MKIASFLHEYQLDSPFAEWECADPVPFVNIPIGAMFSVIDDNGKLSGWGYNQGRRMDTAGLFYKESDTMITPLATKCPVPAVKVKPESVNIPVCVQILSD